MELSNKWYDRLKFAVTILIPGLATLYVAVGAYVDLWNTEAVVGIAAAVAAFLGLFLNQSAKKYEGAGDLVIHKDLTDGQVYLNADLNDHPGDFKDGQNVTLNVRTEDVA